MRRRSGIAAKQTRTGSQVLLITDLTKAITFSTPMPSNDYHVTFEPPAGITSSFGVGSKTANGFNILSVGIALTLSWKATEN